MNLTIASDMRFLISLSALAAAFTAQADDVRPRGPLLPLYAQECGSCHLAYPPGLLPAESWQRLLGNLKQHFGTDASIDTADAKIITAWLNTNAGTYKKAREAPPQDRISRAGWFVREHDELAPEVWQRAAVKSATNCEACHSQAASGSFREREIRIPN